MIVTGRKELVRDWIALRVRDAYDLPSERYEAIGVAREGRLVGGCLYSNFRELAPGEHDIMMTAAGEPGWLTKGAVRALLSYPLVDLPCIRVTTLIAPANKASRRLNEKLGFKLEGKLRNGRGTGRHLLIYSLLKEDAGRWLK